MILLLMIVIGAELVSIAIYAVMYTQNAFKEVLPEWTNMEMIDQYRCLLWQSFVDGCLHHILHGCCTNGSRREKMIRLTETDEQGNWALKGVAWKSLHVGQVITKETNEKLYGALCKLKDYEDSGLSPDEVEAVIELYDTKEPKRLQMPQKIVDHIMRLAGKEH